MPTSSSNDDRRILLFEAWKPSKFGKIGSNLNQIARHFNSGGIHSQEMRKAIDQSVARIYEMKYEVLKMTGDFHSAAGGSLDGNTETHSK